MISLFYPVLPFNSVDLYVPLSVTSSLVHFTLHAVEEGPEDTAEHSQEADHHQNIGRDDPQSELVLSL